jgi:hypothetical protein
MSGGGSKPGERRGGRQPGSKNKATIERERMAQLEAEKAALLAAAEKGKSEVLAAQASGKKLMKDIGFELAQLFTAMAAYHQPHPTGGNPNANEEKFLEYAKLAAQTAAQFAGYESPKLSAVMVGAAVVNHVKVEGGMPDDFAQPLDLPAEQLPPLTTITAEDDYVSPVAPAA